MRRVDTKLSLLVSTDLFHPKLEPVTSLLCGCVVFLCFVWVVFVCVCFFVLFLLLVLCVSVLVF